MKKALFFLLLSGFAIGVFAQQVESEFQDKPDKRKNATYFSNGLQSKYREDTDGAIRNFEQALRYMPDDAASMFELSEQYYNAGRFEEAFRMIQQAANLDPENKWYQMRLGQFYRNLEQYDDYIELYENLTKKYPDDPEMLSELIDAYLVMEQYDKALSKMEVLEKQIGQNDFFTEQRLSILKQKGDTKKLIAELEKLIEQNPENTRYYSMLAQIYAENGKDKDALRLYEKIKEISPEDPYVSISLLEFYDKTGDSEKAFNELISAIRNKNLDLNTKASIYDYWMNKNQDSNDVDEQARQCGEAFLETHPDDKIAYLILGSYYLVKENAPKSKEMYQKSLAIDSTDFLSWQNLIISESRLNENEAVRDHAIKALKYYPMQPVFYWYAGVASAVLKINDEAITFLEKGRRYTTDKIQMANFDAFLGDLYHEQGEEQKAFEAYERTLRNDPDNTLVLNNYAYYLAVKNQDLDKALEMSTKAITAEPNNATYLDTHAWVLYMKGDYKEAEKHMSKALKLLKEPDEVYQNHYNAIQLKLKN
jgi:tetratricopeptide (TPR) repeat protein